MTEKILISLFCLTLLSGTAKGANHSGNKTFRGAWFEVWIPSGFTVIPSIKSSDDVQRVDSAFFRSPDKLAEFYIFSPMWNGTPRDIALNAATEKISFSETRRTGNNTITFYTIQAKNNTYSRSYQDTFSELDNTRRVVGIKYSGKAAYDRYRKLYLTFKKSLRQFAD